MADVPQSHANPAERTEKQVRAYELTLRGLSLRAVSQQMRAEGYENVSHETVRQLLAAESTARVLPLADELRTVQLERLGEMRQAALDVLEREHVTVSHGRIVRIGEPEIDADTGRAVIREGAGEPVPDDAPVLQAIDRLLRVEERIAKLCGLDAPLEVDARVEQKPATLLALIEQARAEQTAKESELTGGGEA